MSVIAAVVRRLFAMSAILALAACGGGGGGGNKDDYSVSPLGITFVATQNGATPPAQLASVSVSSGSVFIRVDVNGVVISSAIFQVTGTTTGTITITPSTPTMSPGTYTGTVTVYGCADLYCTSSVAGSPKVINVSYVVSPQPTIVATPASINVVAGIGSSPVSQNLVLSSTAGSVSNNWTSAIVYTSGAEGWLSVAPSNGSTLPANLVISATAMPAGRYTATITFTSIGSSIQVPVTFVVSGVSFISPYIATTNVGGSVIIRGHGFSSVATPDVKFGTMLATAYTVISDTEILATYPAMAAGSYPVTVSNASVTLTTRAKLVVVDPPTFGDVTISRSGWISGLLYDAERAAVYVADSTNNEIERHRYNGGIWSSDSIAITKLRGIALTPDGAAIIAMSDNSVVHVSTDTFTVTATSDAPFASDSFTASYVDLNNVAVANDGIASIMTITPALTGTDNAYSYNILTRTFTSISWTLTSSDQNVVATGDGSRVIAVGTAGSPPGRVFYYDASSGNYVGTYIFQNAYWVYANRNGSRWIHNLASVYDDQLTLRGTLQVVGTPVFSPNGNDVYVYTDSNGTIHKFDLDVSNGSGGFIEVGTGTTVASAPLGLSYITPYMTISPDGSKLIIVGTDKLQIQAAP